MNQVIEMRNYNGLVNIGTHGYSSQGIRGGYEAQGFLKIDFYDKGYTLTPYYNNPSKAIPYKGKWYLHDELPAYMIKWEGSWHVGTLAQIKNLINKNRKYFS